MHACPNAPPPPPADLEGALCMHVPMLLLHRLTWRGLAWTGALRLYRLTQPPTQSNSHLSTSHLSTSHLGQQSFLSLPDAIHTAPARAPISSPMHVHR